MYYDAFEKTPEIRVLPDPSPTENGVVIKVEATGLCRSDWHGWMGHDPDIRLPHVPGHELAGTIAAAGRAVMRYKVGDRVTVPFVSGCGRCGECRSGNQQVCEAQFQPGFTHWGSFAEYVAIDFADQNLVHLPESMDFATAASLGCRFATSFRAVADQARVKGGEWVAVHGCGGVGLSAIMIAAALGAHPIAIDISAEKLAFAQQVGAVAAINARETDDVAAAVKEITQRRACVDRCARLPRHLLQFNQESAPPRPPRPGGPDAGRTRHASNSDGPGDRPRTRNLWLPRHAGLALRCHAGDDYGRQARSHASDRPRDFAGRGGAGTGGDGPGD
ncbi:Alcohol dehydrogenase [Sinorhizobium sojae CCBAU 05684]|uniref:Alcohol dehydrogenase n=1 Tax=Sinorhizobium sojae CCBAU 05684 TaxID=716928 RepID=A0A249P806_9HYPH|nr:Alcohol dehydrogenase [Sinorhizobium sojae CCBAU 05684]